MNSPDPVDVKSAEKLWFYCDAKNQPVGPVPSPDLQKLAIAGTIKSDTLVIEAGGLSWRLFAEAFPCSQDSPPPLLPEGQRLRAGLSQNEATVGPRIPPSRFTWWAVIAFAFCFPPISAIIVLCSKRMGRLSKIVFTAWGSGFLAIYLLGVIAARTGIDLSPLSVDTAPTPTLNADSETTNITGTVVAPAISASNGASAEEALQEVNQLTQRMESMLSKLDSLIRSVERGNVSEGDLLRNIRQWNIEAQQLRDAVGSFTSNRGEVFKQYSDVGGTIGDPLVMASVSMCDAGTSVWSDTDAGKENLRLAQIRLKKVQANLNVKDSQNKPTTDQGGQPRQIYEQAEKATNASQSRILYKQAADLGDWKAQLQYGNYLATQKEWKGAKEYLIKAAEQGSLDAMNNLGYLYSGATGMPPNGIEALMWYRVGEIVFLEPSTNVAFVKKSLNMTKLEIMAAEHAASKWVKEHHTIKPATE